MDRMFKGIFILCGIFLVLTVPAGAWTSGIDVTTGQVSINLMYGIEPNTTTEFDNGMDSPVPPPAPGMTKYAYFVTEGLFRELYTDIRPAAGWQLYIQSDEDVSVTWNQPPVSLRLTPMTVVDSDVIYQQPVDMDSQQSISLVPGTHYLSINAATESGEPSDPGTVTYHPPTVATATSTPVPDDTPTPTPVPTVAATEKTTAATTAPTAVPVPTGNGEPGMTVAVPANTTTTPTQTPIPALIPLAGLGIFLVIYLRKQ